jgi:hypothetical protein
MSDLRSTPADPEQLMTIAAEGRLSKESLAAMLEQDARQQFLEACADIERAYTEACRAKGDPCLASGCSLEEEPEAACLQPLLQAGPEYNRACAARFIELFRDPANRAPAWNR